MIFFSNFSADVHHLYERLQSWKMSKRMVSVSLLATIASLLQSAGGYVPLFGFLISPFTTLPIVLATLISFRYGLFSYMLTILLLLIIEPAELFIFPFTTGVLGLGLGWGFIYLQKRLTIASLNGGLLFLGIFFPLYVLDFLVFGPMIYSAISPQIVAVIFGFSFVYSFIWIEISLIVIRRLKEVMK